MSKNLRRNYRLMQAAMEAPPRTRRAIVGSNKQIVRALCELVDNLLNGRIPINDGDIKLLHRYKRTLRKLADRRVPIRQKQNQLVQRGGFLPLLIPALTAIATLVAEVIRR